MNWEKINYKSLDDLINDKKQKLETKPKYALKCITKHGLEPINVINDILLGTKIPGNKFYGLPIYMIGDYDVDGICSVSQSVLMANKYGIDLRVRLPKRFSEGYGLSEKIIDEIDRGIIITVDNGICSHSAIQKAKDKGLYVIITDHHLPMKNKDGSDYLPNADIIFNPHLGNTCEFKDYCGAGIVYKLIETINPLDTDFLNQMSVYAAFATIADCVPLVEDNRNIVIKGISNIKSSKITTGMTALLSMTEIYFRPLLVTKKTNTGTITEKKLPDKNKSVIVKTKDNNYLFAFFASFEKFLNENKKIISFSEIESWAYMPKKVSDDFYLDEEGVGFKIAPMLNAPGRLIDNGSEISVDLLTFNGDIKDAVKKALKVYELNEKRKTLVKEGLEKIECLIAEKHLENNYPLTIYCPNLHEGIIGIIAGQLVERYKAPAIVCTNLENNTLKGSARSIDNVNIKELLDKHANLLIKYGGHPEAAGLSLLESDFNNLDIALRNSVKKSSSDNTIRYCLEINANEVKKVALRLKELKPFGEGNNKPVFLIKDLNLTPDIYRGEKYRLCQDAKTIILNSRIVSDLETFDIKAIGFDLAEKYLTLTKNPLVNADNLYVIGTINENHFNGNVTPQIEMIDFKGTTR